MMATAYNSGHTATLRSTQIRHSILKRRIKVGKIKQQEYKGFGKYPIIDQSQNYIAGFCDDDKKVYQGEPVIIFGDHTRVFKFVNFPFVVGADGVKVLIPNRKIYDPKFLFYAMLTLNIPSRGYNRHYKLLREKKLPLPPLSEQRKIVRVLDKIQQAIELQDRIIEQAKNLKKSLMQKLFTEGLYDEEQKETEIGLIPKSWVVVRLGDDEILKETQYGLSVRGKKEGKYPILRMNNLVNGLISINDLQFVDLDEKTFRKFKLEKGEILFNRTNSFELVGKTSIFHLGGDFVFASYLIRLRLNSEIIDPFFFNFYFNWDMTQLRLKGLASRGVSQANISATKLKSFLIPLPPLEEQKQIAHILSVVDEKIEVEQKRKQVLKELFKTMLHRLMSGEIRLKEGEI